MRDWLSIAAVAALAVAAGPAAAITIDEFNDPDGGHFAAILNGNAGDTFERLETGLAAIGGTRLIAIEIESVVAGGSGSAVEVNSTIAPNNFQLFNTVAVDGNATITYDANGNGLNFALAGNTVLQLEGVLTDQLTTFTFTLETFAGGGDSVSCSTSVGAGFSGNVSCDFAGLFNGVPANDIDVISVLIDPSVRGGDVLIDRLVAIPEPTTALLLGVGVGGLACFGRRRR